MEKILSKDEIADLLSAVRHGDVDVDSVGADPRSVSGAAKSAVAESCNLFRADGSEGWKLKNFDLILRQGQLIQEST